MTSPILAYREANLLSREQLAEKLNVSVKRVAEWENHKFRPISTQLEKIAEVFDVSPLLLTTDIEFQGLLAISSAGFFKPVELGSYQLLELGRLLSKFKKENHFTDDDFAKESGLPKDYITSFEAGQEIPTTAFIYRFSTALASKQKDMQSRDWMTDMYIIELSKAAAKAHIPGAKWQLLQNGGVQ
jgi:transcriptional regulator with XRE-family HTH domain